MAHTTIIGIDVSKNFADACAISAQGEVMLETKIFYDTVGLQHFLKQLDQLAGEQRHCAVAVMESTAHYHRILETYLRRSGIDVVVINPLQSGSMKNLEIRKIKNDRTDAKRIAQLYLFKMLRGNAVDSILVGALKDLTRQRSDIISERVKFSNKLTALLDQGFPGFRKVFSSLRTKSALAVLARFPGPEEICGANRIDIAKTIAFAAGRNTESAYAVKKANHLLDIAEQAMQLQVERGSFKTLITLFAEMLIQIQRAADQIERQIFETAQCDRTFWSQVELLTSIPGIGQYAAVVILAEIGDFSRFKKAKQLVAFAGIDPAVKQSGTSAYKHNKISKRGSPYLRKILDTCTHVAAHKGRNQQPANPSLAAYYEEKRSVKPANVAQCACIHKMLGYIFSVLRNQKPFELRSPEEHLALMRSKTADIAA